MKKSKFLFSTLFFSTLLLAACGNDEEASGTKQEEAPAQAEETQTANDEVETETEEQDAGEQPQGDNETLNPFIAEDSEGNVEILYTNKDPQYTHDMEGFKV